MASDVTVLGLGLMGSALAESLQRSGCRICVWNREDYLTPSVTVNVYRTVLSNIKHHAESAGVDLELLDVMERLMSEACDKGFGDEDIAALVKIFRSNG